jgi:hypothetical protein
MKLLIALLGLVSLPAVAAHPDRMSVLSEYVTITLTDLSCVMFKAEDNTILKQAYAKDTSINQEAEGCYSTEMDGMYVLNLINTTSGHHYGYVLKQDSFHEVAQ